MAIDVYVDLKTTGKIDGESKDSKHTGWVECLSLNLEVLQPKSATASTAGGHTAERCEHKDITFTKLADSSSAKLYGFCSTGEIIPEVIIDFVRATKSGGQVYFKIKIKNVLISNVAGSISEGELLTESVSLRYSAVQWDYAVIDIEGKAGAKSAGIAAWSLNKNTATYI